MSLRRKKKDDGNGWGDLPVADQRRIYSKEELASFEATLKRGGYLGLPNNRLTLEKEMEYLRDQKIISLKKRRPNGMCKTMNDFDIAIKHDMAGRWEEETERIRQWQNRKGYIEYAKNMHLLGSVNLAQKYAPEMYRKKIEQQKMEMKTEDLKPLPDTHPEKIPLPDTHPAGEKKVPIDPKVLDPNDIKL